MSVIEKDLDQENIMERLNRIMEALEKNGKKKRAKRSSGSAEAPPYLDLAKALYLIETHRDGHRRITWKDTDDKKELIFAYLRRAEADGIDIEKTTEMQKYPMYRRVFQYVAYNIGSWKDIVDEYKQTKQQQAVGSS